MFQNDLIYRPSDPALRLIATENTLAKWRHFGRGPAFVKLGSRVGYRGGDLNRWLEARRVATAA